MNCKNCAHYLQLEYRFCPNCGAKTEVRRITFKALFRDFLDRLFDLDNSVFKTIIDLVRRPEKVIDGYLKGIRKRYLNPVSYLGITLTLAGILIFVMQKRYGGEIDFTGGAQNINPEFSRKWGDIVFDLNALFFLLYIPVISIPAYLVLNKLRYNLAEYFVVFIYIMSEYGILTFPISLALLLIDPNSYIAFNQPSIAILLLYALYVLWRLTRYKWAPFLGRSVLFLLMTVLLFFLLIIGVMVVLILTGYFSMDDFRPVEAAGETAYTLGAAVLQGLA